MNTKRKMLITFVELSIHFFYLILFYAISVFLGKSDYLTEILKSIFNPDLTRNLVISLLVTFSLIGMVFCLSIVSSKKLSKPDFIIAEMIFKFGIDYLYFITLSSATIGSIVLFFTSISEGKQIINIIFVTLGFFLSSFILRVVHHSFEANAINNPTDSKIQIK